MGLSGAIRPEFLARDIPDDLPYASSVVWVNFVHGVHLAHALDPQLLEHLELLSNWSICRCTKVKTPAPTCKP
jgi:hypothetical protein